MVPLTQHSWDRALMMVINIIKYVHISSQPFMKRSIYNSVASTSLNNGSIFDRLAAPINTTCA